MPHLLFSIAIAIVIEFEFEKHSTHISNLSNSEVIHFAGSINKNIPLHVERDVVKLVNFVFAVRPLEYRLFMVS